MGTTKAISKLGFTSKSFIGWAFKISLASIIIGYFLINAIISGIQARDFWVGAKQLGSDFVSPMRDAQDFYLDVSSNPPQNVFKTLWLALQYFTIVYKIYLWLKVLSWFIGRSPISNESQKFINFFLAVIFFYFIQAIYVAYALDKDANFIVNSTIDLFRGITFFINNINLSFDNLNFFSPNNFSCSGESCVL